MTSEEFEKTLQRAEELVKKVNPYTELIEGLRAKCDGDASKLSDQEREDMDTAAMVMAPMLRELSMLQGIINGKRRAGAN